MAQATDRQRLLSALDEANVHYDNWDAEEATKWVRFYARPPEEVLASVGAAAYMAGSTILLFSDSGDYLGLVSTEAVDGHEWEYSFYRRGWKPEG